jgi:NADH-quinone oxidoreductase subunit C
MMNPQDIHSSLTSRFGEAILEAKTEGVLNPYIVVAPDRVRDIALVLRDDPTMRFDTLSLLTGMDYTGGKLGVVYHLASVALGHTIVLKAHVTADNPHVASVASVWRTADWHEREAFDMIGLVFDGHPDLRRILMPDDWVGHPLRKDYKVPEYYNGMKVPY